MSELVEIVDSLENKVSKLLHKMELLHQLNAKLKQELELQKEENGLQQKEKNTLENGRMERYMVRVNSLGLMGKSM